MKYLNSCPRWRMELDFPIWRAPRSNRGFLLMLAFQAFSLSSMFLLKYVISILSVMPYG